jgi:DNA-binding FrmR family transcriptional regulator
MPHKLQHLDNDIDCTAILQQIASIRGAVNGLKSEMIENLIRTHLGLNVSQNQHQQELEQLVTILSTYLK